MSAPHFRSSRLPLPVEAPAVTSIGVCLELVLALLLLIFSSAASAGALNLQVSDAAGKALADAVALLEPASAAARPAVRPMADVSISQARRQFSPRVTLITTGTRALFPNFDTVRHQVYSFSPVKTFELKLYAGTPGAPVTFDKPGIAVLGCNIHDSMAAWVVVADTPWFGLSAANGRIRIDNLPPGGYQLRLWHPRMTPGAEPLPVPVTIGTGDLEHLARLNVAGLDP